MFRVQEHKYMYLVLETNQLYSILWNNQML